MAPSRLCRHPLAGVIFLIVFPTANFDVEMELLRDMAKEPQGGDKNEVGVEPRSL